MILRDFTFEYSSIEHLFCCLPLKFNLKLVDERRYVRLFSLELATTSQYLTCPVMKESGVIQEH